MTPLSVEIAIIGAGTSGCFIASLLSEAGIDCGLIEKSRGLGGRCSRRRIDNNYGIDLGAPEFSMGLNQNPILHDKMNEWLQAGYLSLWHRQTSRFDTPTKTETLETLCATPSMNAWHKNVAGHINAVTGCKVHALQKTDRHWQLLDEDGKPISTASKVVITSPPEQAFDLLKEFDGFQYCQTASHTSLPQYVCAIGFTQPLNLNADLYQGGHSILASAIRENSKPGRTCPPPLSDVWVLHSTHDWAQQQAAKTHQQAAIELTEAFCQHFGIETKPKILTSHYWRLARHSSPQHQHPSFIWNENLQIGCCGDWLDSGDMYGALHSGLGLSQAITHASERKK